MISIIRFNFNLNLQLICKVIYGMSWPVRGLQNIYKFKAKICMENIYLSIEIMWES